MSLYSLHGLVLDSPLELPALLAPPNSQVTLHALYGSADAELPPEGAEVLASSDTPGARYCISRGAFGVHCSYGELGEVLFTPDSRVIVRVAADDAESASALLSGSALAVWLVANAQLVLHASAVAWDELAVAIVGASNSGKTTLAAQCVLAGATLLGDDVLRVDVTTEAARWYAGVRWLRLRRGSNALVGSWSGPAYQSARDARWVVKPRDRDLPPSGRLAALVFPALSKARNLSVTAVRPAEALRRLLLVPRVRGLKAPELLRDQLRLTGELVRRVPCFDVSVPVGPPFLREDAEILRSQLCQLLGAMKSS